MDTIPYDNAHMPRRTALGLFAAAAAAAALPGGLRAATAGRLGNPEPFSWNSLVAEARALSRKPHQPLPESTRAAADYDAAGKLTYGEAPNIAGNIRLFPAVRNTAPKPVRIAVVEGGQAREIVDTSGLFVGGHTDAVGFRVMDTSNRSDWLAFQGASYFRSSGSRDQYGLSARAVAIDTGLAKGEEFPDFTQFWIEQTGPDSVRIHALLDGPSLTGAYAFDCRKTSAAVTQDVTASLFLRRDIEQLGIAAASSMFWYDQSSPPRSRADWRPEIHDSDGLAVWAANGERVWRPLENPSVARLHSFRADAPKGFGLLQRDQVFEHYQDDGVFYDRRPSLWVEPKGNWGPGAVGLYEMPTSSETLDNIALFWRSDRPARAGQRRDFAYRLTWTSNDPTSDRAARCVDVYDGPGGAPGAPPLQGVRKYVFDFSGPSLSGLDRSSGVTAETDLPADAIVAAVAYPVVGAEGRWRAMLDVRTSAVSRPEFRLFLKRGNSALTETVIKAIET